MTETGLSRASVKAEPSYWSTNLARLNQLLVFWRDFGYLHDWFMPVLLTGSLLGTIAVSICIGPYPMSVWRAGSIAAHLSFPWPLPDELPWPIKELTVIQVIRLPRVLLATVVGIALGMSGSTLQGLMRNPLVGPDLVGVSSGAAMGGVAAIMMDWSSVAVVALAFVGGMLAMGGTYLMARLAKSSDGIGIIISGIFMGAFCLSCVSLGLFLGNDNQQNLITFWLLGTMTKANQEAVWLVAMPTFAGGSLLMLLRWRLNLLSLGNVDAFALGLNVSLLRLIIIAIVSLMVAAQVSVSGIIGWVGLVIPHFARMLVGPDHRKLLPASALLGGLYVLLIDDFTRVILRTDMPTGVLTTLIGTPFICFLFWKKQTKGWSND